MVGGLAEKKEVKVEPKNKNQFDELHSKIKEQDYSKAIEFYENL